MKKKWLSKVLSLTLAGAMLLGVTACGQQNNEESTSKETSKAEQSSQVESSQQTSSDAVSTEPEVVEVTYPMDTDVTFGFFVVSAAKYHTSLAGFDESPWHIKLAEKTGVDVEWSTTPTGGNVTQTLQLLLTDEKERPDVWDQASITPAKIKEWIQDDIILDLTDYLPEYAPDFWEYINKPENEMVRKSIVDDDGRFWYIPAVRESDYNITYQGPMIRKDWLDACGLDIPVTMDDMEEVLIAFKEKYGAAYAGRLGYFKNVGFCAGTDAYASLTYKNYVDDNGKIQCGNVAPEWKAYLEYLNRWYEMGLIDADFFTADNAMVQQKAANNKAGVIFAAMSQLTNYIKDAEASGNGAEWIGIEYLRTAPGEPTSMIQSAASCFDNVDTVFVNSKIDEDKIPVVLNWLNYFFTEEGIEYTNFGEEGEAFTRDAEGNIQWTELITNDPLGQSAALTKYTGWTGTGFGIQAAEFVKLKNAPEAGEAVYKWIDNTEAMKHCIPALSYTDEESMQYKDRESAISKYVEESALKFVTGEKSLDEFDAFVAELDKLGLQECLKVHQSAYDRFLAR